MDDIREINSQSQQALAHGDTIKVAKLDGHATVRHADGSVSALKVGMILKMGDVVITSPGVRASIQVAEGESIPCGDEKGDVLAIDKTVLDFFSDAQDFQPTDSNAIKDALNDLNKVINPEDLNNLEATAAGFDPGALIIQNSTPNPISFQGFNYHNPFLLGQHNLTMAQPQLPQFSLIHLESQILLILLEMSRALRKMVIH